MSLNKEQERNLKNAMANLANEHNDVNALEVASAILFEKHGRPDRHGYVDWMHVEGFKAALKEVLDTLDKEMS